MQFDYNNIRNQDMSVGVAFARKSLGTQPDVIVDYVCSYLEDLDLIVFFRVNKRMQSWILLNNSQLFTGTKYVHKQMRLCWRAAINGYLDVLKYLRYNNYK